MKITNVDVRFYSRPYKTPITNGKYTYTAMTALLVQIFTDDGASGFGWANGSEIGLVTAQKMIPYLIGEDPLNVDRIWEKLYLPKVFGRKGPTIKAQSAIDIALWDLRGKVFNVPLYKLLGGFRNEVPVYVAGGYYETGKSNDDLKKEMEANLAKGVKVMKMKIGAVSISEDLKRIEAVLKVLDGKAEIMVDANNAYSRMDALKMGYELDRLGSIYWFEEPVSCDDIEGTAILVDKIRTPIAIGENSYTRYEFRDLVGRGQLLYLTPTPRCLEAFRSGKKWPI
jgi:D-arabinonate dehydratase